MLKEDFPAPSSCQGSGLGRETPLQVQRTTYASSPLHSSRLETASHLAIVDSLVQPHAPCCRHDVEHWAGVRRCALTNKHSKWVKAPCGGQLTLSSLNLLPL